MEQKVLLEIKDSYLIIDFGKDRETASASRVFFELLLSFYYSSNQNKFVSRVNSDIKKVFNETIKFLKSKGIKYRLLNNAKQFEQELFQLEGEFKKRIKNALAIKREHFRDTNIKDFSRKLKGYQYKGLRHLIAIQNAANFSVPGSGKTTVAYAYYDYLVKNRLVDKLLVIGPRSSFLPWEEEYSYCFKKEPNVKRISGNISYRKKIYISADKYQIFLTTYQTAANDIDELASLCRRFRFLIILDEAHYIKRIEGGYWSERILKLASFAKRRVVLTGTPAPNSYDDLWNQIYFLWPDNNILGSKLEFHRISRNKDHWKDIRYKINPLFYRTSKKDLSLPVPRFEKIIVKLAPLQKRIYEAIAMKFLSELNETPEVTSKLRDLRKAKIVRLLEASSNPTLLSKYAEEFKVPPIDSCNLSLADLIYRYPRHEVPSKILVLLDEIRDSVSREEKVIVWTNFVLNIKMLSKILDREKIGFARVYGEIPKDFSEDEENNREKEIIRFKKDKETLVLLANPAACSESISLHRICKKAIYLDRTFNCGQYLQSLDRIHRLGLLSEDKIVYKLLISKDTIDEVIHERLLEKAKRMESLFSESLPVGAFDTEATDVIGNESEVERDFELVMQDLITRYGKK